MTDRAARLVCVALVVAAVVGGIGATAPGASAQTTDRIAGSQIAPDDVSMRIELRSDGSAAWTVEYRVRLDDQNTTEAFESLRSDIEANESQYTAQFGDRMASTAATAENATGREMAVRNVSVTATRQQLPQDYGVVTYTFVWTNFAVVENGEIRAGDALAGLFLDEETSLQFSWPEGYALDTVQPDPDDTRLSSRIVVWNGPLDFGPNEPTLVAAEQPSGGEGTPTDTPADDAGADDGGNDALLIGALVLLGGALGIGGWFLYRRRDAGGRGTGSGRTGGAAGTGTEAAGADTAGRTSQPSAGSDTDGATAETADAEDPSAAASASATDTGAAADSGTDVGADADAGSGGSGVAGSSAGGGGSSAGDGDEAPDSGGTDESAAGPGTAAADDRPWEDELLSNEERVLALVEHKGGRMKQQEVAGTLEWTDAKTSQVVRKMRDEDKLDAFRLGRENVLVLPGEGLGPGDSDEE
ncbi:helix-turn-helix transcriptional regulator [Halobellus limi]|uniref:DUF4897 domain-containing protein n=1 Tax=Halobellus limi TaxID=699433 RepID=A0A1H5UP89_9EURY|nr:hypothetical protein [Halobellus limi]QCC46971.1 hypothetical protein DV707_04395 [Halobellus limi]SEF76913.1 hypothetical protein SAMN04488133_0673 [Halobellus limi]